MAAARYPASEIRRFWERVDRSGGPDACWPWQGPVDDDGYGWVFLGGKKRRTHRVALSLKEGPLGPFQGQHSCDNPPCCNPGHLSSGLNPANVLDRDRKGRTARGTRNGAAALDWEKVADIRAGKETVTALAKKYQVSRSTIRRCRDGETWNEDGAAPAAGAPDQGSN